MYGVHRPGVNTIRENPVDINGPEYQKWIKFTEDGGLLKDVPEPFRLDEVCLYATKNSKEGNEDYSRFERDVLPFIPVDVLMTGFLAANIGHELKKKRDAEFKARGDIFCSRLPPPLPRNEGEKRKRKQGVSVPICPSVAEIRAVLGTLSSSNRYASMETDAVSVQFRFSVVPRRENILILDFDIVQIQTKMTGQNIGTQFFKNAVEAADSLGSGIYLEQCITEASQKFRKKLIRDKLATPYKEEIYGPMNALSVVFSTV